MCSDELHDTGAYRSPYKRAETCAGRLGACHRPWLLLYCCCCSAAALLCCCCSAARRADAAHSTQRRARDSIGTVTMPSARLVSTVVMNSMRLIGGRDQLEADRDGLRWDRAVYHACEGQGSHGPRDDARWARGL